MASVYFHDRVEAGKQIYQALHEHVSSVPSAVITLNSESATTAAQVASLLGAPLHLFMAEDISVPGNLVIGSVNNDGTFTSSYGMSEADSQYWYGEFRSYIDQTKQQTYSQMNREIGNRTIIRKDLLKDRSILVVADTLVNPSELTSLMAYLKPIKYNKLLIGVPIVTASVLDMIKLVSDFCYCPGIVDMFYGVDHYFEDNTMLNEENAINLIQKSLAAWPA